MAIPAEDSAALMEGMMLHRKGLACISRMGMPASSASAPTMAPSASTPPLTTPDQVSPNDQTRPISATTITFQESGEVLGTEKEGSGSVFSAVDNCGDEKRSGWEEQKESMPQAEGSGDGKKTTTDGLEHSAPTEASQREPGGEALASRGATGMSGEYMEGAAACRKSGGILGSGQVGPMKPKDVGITRIGLANACRR